MAALLAVTLLASSAWAQEVPDNGDFVLQFGPATGAEGYAREALHGDGRGQLHLVIADINAALHLAEQVKITFISAPASASPAKYNRDTNQIIITYEFVVDMHDLFEGDITGWYPNVEQLVLHEMAHALIDVNRIPAPEAGYRELVADQLAFFIMSEFHDSPDDLMAVAAHFRARKPNSAQAAGTDHYPSDVRAAQFLCWIDGKIAWMSDQGGECASEYEDLMVGWGTALEPSWSKPFREAMASQ